MQNSLNGKNYNVDKSRLIKFYEHEIMTQNSTIPNLIIFFCLPNIFWTNTVVDRYWKTGYHIYSKNHFFHFFFIIFLRGVRQTVEGFTRSITLVART